MILSCIIFAMYIQNPEVIKLNFHWVMGVTQINNASSIA